MLTSLLPSLSSIAALLALLFWPQVRAQAAPYLPLLPPLVLAGGLLLAWRFNRGRPALALLGLAATAVLLRLAPPVLDRELLTRGLSVLLPGLLTLLLLLPERGLVSRSGMVRLTGLTTGFAGLVLAVWQRPVMTATLLRFEFTPLPQLPFPLPPQPLLLFWALLLLAGLAWTIRQPGPIEPALLTAAGLAVFTLQWPGLLEPEVGLALAGLAPALAIIEVSHNLAFSDELTGLPGRRALNEALRQISGRYSLAMIDIDHFKAFNDRYGHDVGDQVLKMVAGHLARVPGGRAYRYGGEEFAILFGGRDRSEAEKILDSLRSGIESAGFILRRLQRPRRKPQRPKKAPDRKRLSVTVSIGVAEQIRGERPDEVVKRADQALYRAKRSGRNRVCVAG